MYAEVQSVNKIIDKRNFIISSNINLINTTTITQLIAKFNILSNVLNSCLIVCEVVIN